MAKFAEVLTIINGKNQKKVENPSGKYPIYGSGGIMGYADDYICNPDTVIIGRKGSINNPIYVDEPFWNVDTAFGLEANKELLMPKYLYYFCISFNFESLNTTVTIPSLTKQNLLNVEIPLPPLETQKQIASTLDKVTDLINKRKQQLEKLDELVKSRFVEMFGDPETNPYGWEKTTVGEVCSSIVRGPFGSALKKEFFVEPDETTYKVYEQKHAIQKLANIGTYYITAEKFVELKRFECVAGDILMSCSGTMGELYQLPEDCEKGLINQALCKFTLNEKILTIVFLIYMKQTIGNLETKGSGIQNIAAVSYVKAMPINLPPMDVQTQFAAFVESVDRSKQHVKESLEKLETLKKSLMQEYFDKGEINMDYKTMSDSELAEVMVNYIERVNTLLKKIDEYLTNPESCDVKQIRESYKQLKDELSDAYHYVDLTRNRKGSELYMNAFTKSIRGASVYGLKKTVNAIIDPAFRSSVEEACYRLKKYRNLEGWKNLM